MNNKQVGKLIWDAHCCVPLLPSTQLDKLLVRHHRSGFRFVSINIGMDMIPVNHILLLLDQFKTQINACDFLMLVNSIEDIDYACQHNLLAVAFDLEGGLAFLESEHMISLFSSLGVKQALLAYNRNNSLAGGCFDTDMTLTSAGKSLVSAMTKHGMIIDCSHTGFQSSMDIMEFANAPVIFSHSNAFAVSKNARNLQDLQIKSCAQTGGVVCISGLSWLLGQDKPNVDSLMRHIDYIVNLAGISHVGIGLDYVYDDHVHDIPKNVDMNFWWPNASFHNRQFTCSYLAPEQITDLKECLNKNYSESDVKKILGENMLNLAKQVWRG